MAVSATKAMNGHSMAATSAHELIHCALMLRQGFIAPSINVVDPDPAAPASTSSPGSSSARRCGDSCV
jgi:3-oxoacyl-(acyl-carrier-protein) synthase